MSPTPVSQSGARKHGLASTSVVKALDHPIRSYAASDRLLCCFEIWEVVSQARFRGEAKSIGRNSMNYIWVRFA
jgi:hypothetical protein